MLAMVSMVFLLKMPILAPGRIPRLRKVVAISSDLESRSLYEMNFFASTTAGQFPKLLTVLRKISVSNSDIIYTRISCNQIAQNIRRARVEETADGVANIDG